MIPSIGAISGQVVVHPDLGSTMKSCWDLQLEMTLSDEELVRGRNEDSSFRESQGLQHVVDRVLYPPEAQQMVRSLASAWQLPLS